MKDTKVYTYSILYSATEAFASRLPYVTAILEREDGTRFAALLDGFTEGMQISIGQAVKFKELTANGQEIYSL